MRRAAAAGFAGVRLTNVAAQVGLDFRQGAFRFGVTPDVPAMMGGGLCWLDYNNDGWLDLFVVNSYAESDLGAWDSTAACRRARSSATTTGRFVNVTASAGAGLAVRGAGLRRRRPERRRPHRPLRLDGPGRQAALEQRRRHLHRGRPLLRRRLLRLALRRRGRRRERRRAPRPLRRRLHRGERADPRLLGRVSDEPSRGARPALPERGQRPERPRPLPRGRQAGRARPGAVRPLARRGLHRPERRRAARPLRRERRGPEPLLRQRPRARPASASASSTGPAAGASPTGTPGMGIAEGDYSRDGRPDLLVTNSRGQGARGLPQPRRRRSRTGSPRSPPPSARTSPAGATRGST